ncbi:MAG: HigA family addiction module antidote protein [Gammaproteobacteria bacterium]|nr:HigA family addiction module antidote protein [Gammaproteobacteria bacterium]
MRMKSPPHPGISVREDCLKPLNLSVTAAAEILGVSRQALNNVLNEAAGISAEMAVRLDKAFGGGAETWLALQMAYDLAAVRRNSGKIRVRRVSRNCSHRHAASTATTSASR